MVTVTCVLVALTQFVVVLRASAYAVYVPALVPLVAVVGVPPGEAVYESTVTPLPAVAEPVCANERLELPQVDIHMKKT